MTTDDTSDLRADGSPEPHLRDHEADTFKRYAAIIRRLRAEDGCPWDRKQTLHTLRRFIVEEAFEVLAAINDYESASAADTASRDGISEVIDELGDVFLVSLLLADALEQETGSSLETVLLENGRKLIRRHPHVFGSVDATTSEEVVTNWNRIKEEQEGRSPSIADVSTGLPPLERAYEMQKKAAKVGFDWETVEPALAKLKEEIGELEEHIQAVRSRTQPFKDDPGIEEEVGDLLFSAVNVSRHLKTDPSVALAGTNEKFLNRFQHVERQASLQKVPLSKLSLETLDNFWDQAKAQERRPKTHS